MHSIFAIDHSYLIPLLPLLGAAVAGFFGARFLKGQSHWPIWITVGASAVLSILILVGMIERLHHGTVTPLNEKAQPEGAYNKLIATGENSAAKLNETMIERSRFRMSASQDWFTWIEAGAFKVTAGFFFDPLTAVMLCVVCGIGFLITVFAAGYMKGEAGYFRFFAYLGLFIFAMTMLVMGNNFILLYLGWEGVGLCSYLLIGYYYDKPSAREAAKKAFLVNRIGDFGFGLGIMLIYVVFGNVSYFGDVNSPGVLTLAADPNFYAQLAATGQGWKVEAAQWIPFLLMLGAFGKSAQFPLYVWLPDAMEGPTPVSALIHAATMVTAGVYMIARCSTLFVANESALIVVAFVGAFTALFAGTIALRQFDLKKVFAYSTVSQLGFMFVAVGVLAPVAGVFHLVTHAFFKALLFLSSGVVMHAMLGHLDMRKMSGLKHVLPKTRWLMLIGCLALAGWIPMSGFWSKDEILVAAWEANKLLGAVMLLTALLTAYYTFRLYFRVFEGPRVVPESPADGHGHAGHDDHDHGHEHEHKSEDHSHHNHEPMLMILPLVVLAVGAIAAGALAYGHSLGHFLGQSPSFIAGEAFAREFFRHKHGLEQMHVDAAMWGQPVAKVAGEARHVFSAHNMVMASSVLIAALGTLLAYLMHLKDRARGEALPAKLPLLNRLLEGKYWVDEIYRAAIVEPLRGIGKVFFAIDRLVVDGLVSAVGVVPQVLGFALKLTTQRGSLQGYALLMLLGIAALLVWMIW